MKRILVVLTLFLTTYISYCQVIHGLNISPNGIDSVDINIEVYDSTLIGYIDSSYAINNTEIDVTFCCVLTGVNSQLH